MNAAKSNQAKSPRCTAKVGTSLFMAAIHEFCQSLGISSKQTGSSPYKLACDALAIYGKPKPEGVSHKHWAKVNAAVIRHARGVAYHSHPKQPPANHAFVMSAQFLDSYEWRSLRMRVIKHYGPKCMCCGATPQTGAVMNVDHIKPRKLFPELALEFSNLQVLCHECNHGKGNWDATDWRPK